MNSNYIVAGTSSVTFENSQYVLHIPVNVGFEPTMVLIQSSDPAVAFGLESLTDTGFTVNAKCLNGAVTANIKFYYLCTR